MTDSARPADSNGAPAGPAAPRGEAPSNPALPAATDDEFAPPEVYDPADYRWVPVRRRPRYDGWTEEKQRRFIEVLADTGLVSAAAKAVGMARETAYRLRRSPHGAAFARAWDAARDHAVGTLEDIAFERAIEGVEQNIYDENGAVVCTKRVYNDRLLIYLLGHLRPDRYGSARARPSAAADTADPAAPPAPPEITLHARLEALEPPLPAPPEQLLDPETLDHELDIADAADGMLPQFFSEQRPARSAAAIAAQAHEERTARGEAAIAKQEKGEILTDSEFADFCYALDPISATERSSKRYR